MKIDLKDNQDEKSYISREFPPDYKFVGESEDSDTVKVFIKQETLGRVDEYLSGDLNKELGGVLLGDICVNSSSQKFIFIDNLIIAKHSNSSLSRLTFTHDTWDYINKIQEEDYPDRKILGWFHSHPGHTVFLSNYDLFIHENFFNMEYMTAYVFDPTIKERGFFNWKDGKIVKSGGYYITDPAEDNYYTELLPIGSENESPEIISKRDRKLKIKKPEFNGAVMIALLFFALLVLRFMIYNIYEIRQKALLKDEYKKDLAEIRNENRILSERLNILVAESELKKGFAQGNKLANTETPVNITDSNKTTESKPDVTELKKEVTTVNTEKSPPVNVKIEEENKNTDVTVYKVKSGDTLEKISNQFYKSRAGIDVIMKHNKIKNKADIKIGQQLEIPVTLQ